jgi:hypothetical protein
VPIYWGTLEVNDVFHEDSFLYYDIDDPRPILDKIAHLETNRTAYEEMLNAPILKHGKDTIEDYFSLTNAIGNGALKRKIRAMMGLPKE